MQQGKLLKLKPQTWGQKCILNFFLLTPDRENCIIESIVVWLFWQLLPSKWIKQSSGSFKRLLSCHCLAHLTLSSTLKPCQWLFDAAVIVPGNVMNRRPDRKQQENGTTALWSPLIILICARQQLHTANGLRVAARPIRQLIFVNKYIWKYESNTVWWKKAKGLKQLSDYPECAWNALLPLSICAPPAGDKHASGVCKHK